MNDVKGLITTLRRRRTFKDNCRRFFISAAARFVSQLELLLYGCCQLHENIIETATFEKYRGVSMINTKTAQSRGRSALAKYILYTKGRRARGRQKTDIWLPNSLACLSTYKKRITTMNVSFLKPKLRCFKRTKWGRSVFVIIAGLCQSRVHSPLLPKAFARNSFFWQI